ncbi:MAG: hypothetical protein L6R37_007927 [Teloschistes peruensis]|nr:MAG: hypothetical protein L6R37_007927 [Teloschistes peruensis]
MAEFSAEQWERDIGDFAFDDMFPVGDQRAAAKSQKPHDSTINPVPEMPTDPKADRARAAASSGHLTSGRHSPKADLRKAILGLENAKLLQLDGLSKTMDRVVEHLAELQPFLPEIRTLLKESLAKSDRKAHLFKKHLSKHSISAYRKFCRDVGVTFEAVHSSDSGNGSGSGFSTEIEKLETEKHTLYIEIENLKEQLAKAMQIKVAAEEEAQRLQVMLSSSKVEKQIMQQNLQSLADMVDYLRSTAIIAAKEFLHKIELEVRLESPGA